MASVEFTQFVRPGGKRRSIKLTVDDTTLAKASALESAGYNFEAEVLSDNRTVSFEVCKEDSDGEAIVLANKLVVNGTEVPGTVQELIDEAYAMLPKRLQKRHHG